MDEYQIRENVPAGI